MKRFISFFGVLLAAIFITFSCDNVLNNSSNAESEQDIRSHSKKNNSVNTLSNCQNAGDTGMTAVHVNQSVNGATIDFAEHTCDMAIYFDENAPKNAVVRNTTVIQETGDSGKSTGLWNNGGDVTVTRSVFTTDFDGQYVPIRFDEEAQGRISNNELTGTHRVGILARGEGTNVQIKDNSIIGSGAKTSGWAENGIQIDQGATAEIVKNKINEHWWDGKSNFASTALLMFGSNSKATNNNFQNNEYSIFLFGNNNKVTGNRTSSDIVSQSELEFKAWGALVGGADNHLAGNSFSSDEGTGAVGVYIYPGTSYSKVTGNRINGFSTSVFDGGVDSMIRGTPAPPQGM